MELSARIREVVGGSGDDGWGLYYRARSLAAAGEEVLNLTIGDHDIKTDRLILDAITAAMEAGELGYTPVEGTPELRGAIARRVAARTGVATDPANVVVTAGGQAGLFAALMATLEPGQSCILVEPHYATYAQTVRAVSGRPIAVAARPEDGFEPDPAAVEAALAPDTRAILINTPNNPTGAVYGRACLEGLADLCRRRGMWLISDEVYDTQVWEGEHLSPRALSGMTGHTIVVNSLSKSHAMTGARLGWTVAPREATARLADLAIATNYGLPGFIQAGGAVALTDAEEAERAVIARYRDRRAAVLEALRAVPGIGVVPPEGGMYVMLDIRPTGLSGTAFAERLLDAERVAVMPGESFGAAGAGHVRVALTVPEASLREAVARIGRFAGTLS